MTNAVCGGHTGKYGCKAPAPAGMQDHVIEIDTLVEALRADYIAAKRVEDYPRCSTIEEKLRQLGVQREDMEAWCAREIAGYPAR